VEKLEKLVDLEEVVTLNEAREYILDSMKAIKTWASSIED
jgi:hypothetical protein